MENSASNKSQHECGRKSLCLLIAIPAVLLLFIVPSVFAGKALLGKEEELTNRLAGFMNGRNLIPKSADRERFSELSQEIKSLESDRNSFIYSGAH